MAAGEKAEGWGRSAVKVLLYVGLIIGLFTFITTQTNTFKQVVSHVGNAAAAVTISTADWVAAKAGGAAATEAQAATAGPKTIWVQNSAPKTWPVARAIAVWNKGLKTAKLKVGHCIPGQPCIKVSEGQVYTPEGQPLVLGSTSRFLGTRVTFNAAAAKLPARYRVFATCHELGHALGLDHRDTHASCMFPSAAGSVARPDQDDFDAVNSQYGH